MVQRVRPGQVAGYTNGISLSYYGVLTSGPSSYVDISLIHRKCRVSPSMINIHYPPWISKFFITVILQLKYSISSNMPFIVRNIVITSTTREEKLLGFKP